MCDTFAIGPEFTRTKVSIFGKNSDREPDEAQLVLSIPRKTYNEEDLLKCTYISIPQVKTTYAMVICKPFWLWGAEMGVNEMGVAIGNEALFTKVKPEKTPGLIGMDLLRLALERADTARAAAEVIIELLVRHGQSGGCGYRDKKFTYMNSFLIMDRKEILVLETLGRDYALKRNHGYATISNMITLTDDWEESSFPDGTDVSCKTDGLMTFFAGSTHRRKQANKTILNSKGTLDISDAFSILRNHFKDSPNCGFNKDVCMHASDPIIRRSQTTCSMVVEFDSEDRFRIFVTAGSVPCLTVFKPFIPCCPYEAAGIGAGRFSEDSYWWRHEKFTMNVLLRYSKLHDVIAAGIKDLEGRVCLPLKSHTWNCTDKALIESSHSMFRLSQDTEENKLKEMPAIARDAGLIRMLYRKQISGRNNVELL
jgi:secernin